MAAVAFIIPVRRDQVDVMHRALRSLLSQHDPDWLAVVVGEGFVPSLPLEARFYAVRTNDDLDGVAGAFNVGLNHIRLAASLGQVDVDWVTFLEPEDTVSEATVARLRAISLGVDTVVFRGYTEEGSVVPHPSFPALVPGDLTLGIVARRGFIDHFNIDFDLDASDLPHNFLRRCMDKGGTVLLYPAISYYEKGNDPSA